MRPSQTHNQAGRQPVGAKPWQTARLKSEIDQLRAKQFCSEAGKTAALTTHQHRVMDIALHQAAGMAARRRVSALDAQADGLRDRVRHLEAEASALGNDLQAARQHVRRLQGLPDFWIAAFLRWAFAV